MSEHTRRVPADDGAGHVEVAHGDRCVALLIDGGRRAGVALTPDDARRLAGILTQQADASERDDQP